MVIVSLTGVRSGSFSSLRSPMIPPSPLIGPQHQILVHDDAQRPAGSHGDGRLDVEVLLDNALARLIGALLGGLANSPPEVAFRTTEPDLAPDAEQRGECDTLEQGPGVIVDLVLEPGIPRLVGGRQVV